MKKRVIITLVVLLLVFAGGYYIYKSLVPSTIAEAIVSGNVPDFVPERYQRKLEDVRVPFNKGAEALLRTMHDARIPLDDILAAIDALTKEQIYAFLDEVHDRRPGSSDKVFDLMKKHFPTKFDPEVFRKPFNDHFPYDKFNGAVVYGKLNRNVRDLEIGTVKAVMKKVVIEKNKEIEGLPIR